MQHNIKVEGKSLLNEVKLKENPNTSSFYYAHNITEGGNEDHEDSYETENSLETDDYDTDEIIYDNNLLNAQQHWEQSLLQLNQVLNWIILPLVGSFLGRRIAVVIWKRIGNLLSS